jgi:hypothetical protein
MQRQGYCEHLVSTKMTPAIVAVLVERAIGARVLRAMQQLLTCDSYLLQVNANERSITARLAIYLQIEFSEWTVDCEYNRDGVEPKRLGHLGLYPDAEDEEGKTVFPDIVIHQRGTGRNHLAIEVKKSTSTVPRNTDLQKLRGYKHQLHYENTLFIEFLCGQETGVSSAQWVDA